jgi:hypothetical protein
VAIGGVEAVRNEISESVLLPLIRAQVDSHDTDLGSGSRDVEVGGLFSDSGHDEDVGEMMDSEQEKGRSINLPRIYIYRDRSSLFATCECLLITPSSHRG